MKKQNFLEEVRRKGGRFRVDDITIQAGDNEFTGKGSMEVVDDQFELTVNLLAPSVEPPSPLGFVSSDNFWTVKGMIEDEICFMMRALPSSNSRNYAFGRGERLSLKFSTHRLELGASGFDSLTTKEQHELQRTLVKPDVSGSESNAGKDDPTDISAKVYFVAVLPDFKLVDRNGGTITETKNDFLGESSHSTSDTFSGEMSEWEFGLIQRDGDLHVHFISKPEHHSTGEQQDWQLFTAFLNALAFIHGRHGWPFSVEHRRDGKLLVHRLQLNGEVARTPHAPFSEALAFGNAVGGPKWSFRDTLEKAYAFFAGESKLSRESLNLLFILREASAPGVPQRISLLCLCTLLESLFRVIYEEKVAPQQATEIGDFLKAKQEVLDDLKRQNRPSLQRLIAILANAEPVNNRLRFCSVINYLALEPQERWNDLYDLWGRFRNPLSHRMSQNKSNDSAEEDTLVESKIAGAINCVVLKLMGYAGPVRFSAFEDKYGRI
jgi:hypothetical protein